ncbi:ABC transporter permease [Dyella silvatica]|uniref:ABC transporter permease n=1 Tax=Dyella silvatica TaxID=2992128 RepID=UPI0022500FA7|nr:ABC transporter permease [Dyella silvatica]
MNPSQAYSTSILSLISSLVKNFRLIQQMAKREVIGRYRGSMAGLIWSFLNPLLMLVIYTFVFSVVFKARWGGAAGSSESKADFAIVLFVGLIIHTVFAECINRAPVLILSNTSYVKKVIFPLEALPWIVLGSALFHATVSIVVLLIVQLALGHSVPWTAIFFPVILVPLIFTIMGFSFALAALGVYVRDISQVTTTFTSILFFISPIVYPLSSLPPNFQIWMKLSPLTFIIEEGRKALIYGQIPDMEQWCVAMALGLIIAWMGFVVFQKMRKGFADVL